MKKTIKRGILIALALTQAILSACSKGQLETGPVSDPVSPAEAAISQQEP